MSVSPAENSALVPFEFEGVQVRVVQREGATWFVAEDVCSVLGTQHASSATAKLGPDEKGLHLMSTPGGDQNLLVVSEAGLYVLVLRCRKAMEEGTRPYRFRRWVTSTVLPTIRKTGSYQATTTPEVDVPELRDPDALCRLLLYHATKRIEAENRAKIAESTLEVTQPKADCYDLIANAEGLFNIRDSAKLLGQSPTKFMMFLRAGYLYQRGSAPIPRQEYIDRGILSLKVHMVNDKARPQSLLTPKGLAYFAKKLGVELQRELFPKAAVTA